MKKTTYILMGLVALTFTMPVFGIILLKNSVSDHFIYYDSADYNYEIIVDPDTIMVYDEVIPTDNIPPIIDNEQ